MVTLPFTNKETRCDDRVNNIKFLFQFRTIIEEKETPVVAQRSTRTKKVQNSSENSISDAAKHVSSAVEQNSVTTKTTTVVTTSSKVVKASGDKQRDTPKAQTKSSSKTTREVSQNESNLLFEQAAKLKTSTPRSVKLNTSGELSINGNGLNLDEHVPFKEYHEAGEYWK